jgi:phage head maturation protease
MTTQTDVVARVPLHVDVAARTVEGFVVPYGRVATTSQRRYRVAAAALWYGHLRQVLLLRQHSYSLRLGRMVEHRELPAVGVFARYTIRHGARGDEALALAQQGRLWFSAGFGYDEAGDTMPDPDQPGVTLLLRAFWRETSLTESPAFTTFPPAADGVCEVQAG